MNDTFDQYDYELLGVLETMVTPNHRPTYGDDVLADLRAEAAERRGATARSPSHATGGPPPSSGTTLALAPSRGSPRVGVRRLAVVAAVAAAVTLGVLAWAGLPGRDGTGSTSALAATIATAIREGTLRSRTLQGEYVESFAPAGAHAGQVRRARFALDAGGSYRAEWTSVGGLKTVQSYDAGTLAWREWWVSVAGRPGMGKEYSGVVDYGLDVFPTPPVSRLGAYVRAALAAPRQRLRISETTYAGRAVWRLDRRVPDWRHGTTEEVALVDQDTGFTMLYRLGPADRPSYQWRLTSFAVDAPLSPGWLSAGFPKGTRVDRRPGATTRIDPVALGGALRIDALAPGWVPSGYELTDAAVSRGESAIAGSPRGSLTYRRGFDRFVVSIVPNAALPPGSRDPFDVVGSQARVSRMMLRGGALEGRRATLVLAPDLAPYLWVAGAGETVTIAGDLTPAELVAVAQSLRALPTDMTPSP
jgi:hypothetical protein